MRVSEEEYIIKVVIKYQWHLDLFDFDFVTHDMP